SGAVVGDDAAVGEAAALWLEMTQRRETMVDAVVDEKTIVVSKAEKTQHK
ncbi:hypothetical protein A2U01_0091997, partial [Trifolium medium]|nr:hypothetical protein [Trifolium medium]